MIKNIDKELKKINDVLFEKMEGKGISFKVDNLSSKYHSNINIEPSGYKGDYLDGMAILYEDGVYEVVEQMAGENENELHIFYRTKSFKRALSNMMKGNKRKEFIEKWD